MYPGWCYATIVPVSPRLALALPAAKTALIYTYSHPMMKYRKLLISAALLLLAAIIVWLVLLRMNRPPEAARLLPEGDVLIYANLKPAHLWDLSQSRPSQLEAEYRDFIDQTGIQLERDLDEIAMSRRDTPDGKDTESSEIFAGRFDQQKLDAYLRKLSSSSERYRQATVYTIPHEGHTVRAAILDSRRVAVTNMTSDRPIHAIIDDSHSPGAGPPLLRAYYRQVPALSLGWALVQTRSGAPPQLGGFSFEFLDNTISVASVRYSGDLHLRADVFTGSDDDAKRVTDSADSFLSMYRTVAKSLGARGTDRDVKAAIDSIHVDQKNNVAVFTATLSQNFLKKIVAEAQPESPAPEPSPSPAASQHKRHRRR